MKNVSALIIRVVQVLKKEKLQDKNSSCILKFKVAHLTDSFLKALKIG